MTPTLAERVAFELPCRCGIRPYHTEFCPASHRPAVLALIASIARETREATVRECIEVAKQLADYRAPGAPHGCVLEAGDVEDRLRALLTPPDEQREENR